MLRLLPLLILGAADATPTEGLQVVGFSDDGRRFAAVVTNPGSTQGLLRVWTVNTSAEQEQHPVPVDGGKAQIPTELLSSLGLGNDLGQEKYTKGTKVRAELDLSGPLTVEIAPAGASSSSAEVRMIRGPWCLTRRASIEGAGTSLNLLSVLASRDGQSIAIVLKHTVASTRRLAFVTAMPDPGYARCRAGERPPTEAHDQACRRAVAKLPRYVSDETVEDFEGGAKVPRYELRVGERDAAVTFEIDEGPAVGPIVQGSVRTCWQLDDALTLRLADEDGGKTFDVQLVIGNDRKSVKVGSTSPEYSARIPDVWFWRKER